MQLSKSEEQLMDLIWERGKVFMKELLDSYPNPKPASTTIATLLKRMQEKGYVGYNIFGNSRQYYPLVKKDDHFKKQMRSVIKNYFGNSALQFASFFTKSGNLSSAELEELKAIIDKQLNQTKK
jgi:BlaI family transcriptional regulator, penicillinase repressor